MSIPRPPIRTAHLKARLLVACVAIPALLPAQNPPASSASTPASAPKVLEAFEVTGSRVKRLDYETASPVVTFSAQTIEDKGYATLGEFVQSLPYNNNSAVSEFTTGSFITGAATINPRGLGSNRILTLVNGRRGVPYALTNSASGTPQTVFNFNSIPQAAIDRVEFLKDGASAIYGSDAITGVFNIILKRNYEGSSVDLTLGSNLKHDTLRRSVSIFTGVAKDGWQITGGVTVQTRNSSFIKDYGVTTTNYTYLGVKGTNMNSTIFSPSYLFFSTAAAATASGLGSAAGYYIIPNGTPTANPSKSSFTYIGTSSAGIPNSNRYDFANVTQLLPASESGGAYANLSRELNGTTTAFVSLMYSRSLTHYLLQPYGFTTSLAGLTLPANNPYNPTGQNLTVTSSSAPFGFRSTYLPRREVASTTLTGVAGLRGKVTPQWNWEVAVSYGRNDTTRDSDLISSASMQAALNGTTRATAWNPFGPSDDPQLEPKLYTRSRGLDGKISSLSGDISVTGTLVQLPWAGGGAVGVAAGYEHRHDRLESNPEPNNFIGFTATTPFTGTRDSDSFYAELSLPVRSWLEFQVAGRHERYSDFGTTTKPKYGVKVRLPATRWVTTIVRASRSESFKAPDLGQLYQPQSNAVTTASLLDPLRPQDSARQLPTRVGGNPNLKPEEGKVQYAGAVLEFPAVRGLSVSIDYFDTRITNVINSLSATYLLSAEGRRLFPNAVERDNSVSNPGPIVRIASISNNLGLQLYRGIDYGVRYTLRSTRTGTYTFSAEAMQVLKAGRDPGTGTGFFNNTGLAFDVEWRYNYSLGWSRGNWAARVAVDVVGKFFNDNWTTPGWGENVLALVNPSVTYRGLARTSLTLGITNVLDTRPPANGFRTLGFDDRIYGAGALGIAGYLRARRSF
jgi:iron complex outermembrane receptor protein